MGNRTASQFIRLKITEATLIPKNEAGPTIYRDKRFDGRAREMERPTKAVARLL